ncbi:MAG: alpha/beta hydrolase-fold protein, partial [Candidatus Thiodiazotropha sp.]
MSWNTGIQLNKTVTDTWQALITYRSANTGFSPRFGTDQMLFSGAALEYRIYIDDITDMIGGNLQIKLRVSKTASYFHEVPEFFAYPWFFSKEGSGEVVSIASRQIGRNRKIFIYKPPSFDENSYKLYPTIIAFDYTQELYNMSAELLNKPIVESGTVREYILVGFGDYDPPDERVLLLTPVTGLGYECFNGTRPDGCDGCFPAGVKNYTEILQYMMDGCGKPVCQGGKGNDTLDFLVDTVLPKVQQLTDNRALTDQPNLGVIGFSLGGLMACHAAWTRPATFGLAACQSPSLWWPIINITTNDFFFNEISLKDANLRANRRFQKIYLDVGGA